MSASDRRRGFEVLARAGYAARGVVYVLIGAIAVGLAGSSGHAAGARDAISLMEGSALGAVAVAVIALGLAGFSLWRFTQALLDPEGEARSLLKRGARLASGVAYLSLAAYAASLALGRARAGSGEDEAARDWTARLMSVPFGRWAVALIAAVCIAGFGMMVLSTVREGFARRRRMEAAPGWAIWLGRAGQAAFGAVLAIAAAFALAAALHANPGEARGLPGALEAVRSWRYGAAVFGALAAGLLSFGAFNLAQAVWRRVTAPDPASAAAIAKNRLQRVR